jgi:hypothetical protein
MAWTHYYAGKIAVAKQILQSVDNITPEELRFVKGQMPPTPDDKSPGFYLPLLSKAYGLKGRMALDEFVENIKEFKDAYADKTPEERQKIEFEWENGVIVDNLREAAEAYVLGVGYSQLMSPRSQTLSIIYDFTYRRVRRMNPKELGKFARFVAQSQADYRINKLELENLGNVSNFLAECFGEYASDGR